MTCEHIFAAQVRVAVFEDKPGLGMMEITAACKDCGVAVEFLGMECGVNMNGPTVSPDNREARLAISITSGPAKLRHDRGIVKMGRLN